MSGRRQRLPLDEEVPTTRVSSLMAWATWSILVLDRTVSQYSLLSVSFKVLK